MTFAPLAVAVLLASEPEPRRLEVFAGAGFLTGPDLAGAALGAGVRYAIASHFAASFDLGYGIVDAPSSVQDRWWLMPSISVSAAFERWRLDVGLGLGLGATSGYLDWAAYRAAPFGPIWAFQLVPAARVHVTASMPLSPRLALFLRFDAASLILEDNEIGFRDHNPNPTVAETVWLYLWAGVQIGVL